MGCYQSKRNIAAPRKAKSFSPERQKVVEMEIAQEFDQQYNQNSMRINLNPIVKRRIQAIKVWKSESFLYRNTQDIPQTEFRSSDYYMNKNQNHERVIKIRPSLKVIDDRIQSSLLQEIESLKLIYIDKVIGIPPEIGYLKAIQITVLPQNVDSQNESNAQVILGLHFPLEYPSHIPKIEFIKTEGFQPFEQEALFQQLFDIALSNAGGELIYSIVVKCQEQVTSQHETLVQNKLSMKNLYQAFVQEERQRQRENAKKNKVDGKENKDKDDSKENKDKEEDELRQRLEWLEQRAKNIPDYDEQETDPLPKSGNMLAWQQLNQMELLLVHLIKLVQKQLKVGTSKQIIELMQVFQITKKKELLKLISPKYEVVFNNLFLTKFDKILKQEAEKIEFKQSEFIAAKGTQEKSLSDRMSIMNLLFNTTYQNSNSSGKVLDDHSQNSPQKVLNFGEIYCSKQNNRMETDFDIVQILGRGAFGEVFKVKHKVDGRYYAIKKIQVPKGAALERILREVDLLSRLHHRHVIRYYQAWIDEADGEEGNDTLGELAEEDSEIQIGSGFTVQNSNQIRVGSAFSSQFSQFINTGDPANNKKLVLFIQTEFCTKTLRQHIEDIYKNSLDDNFIWALFRQILEGMVYTHQQKITHRDLKPENIFIDVTGDIKIGDFGLAKHIKNNSVTYSSSVDGEKELPEILSYIAQNMSEQGQKILDKTLNVGTYFYCPKQDTEFDEKRDVYALGVILLELWHPFKNNGERIQVLNTLKVSGRLPKRFQDSHPRQSNLIKWMVQQEASKRPTISQILASEFLPPKIEEEYFRETIKAVAQISSENLNYQKLINAVLNNKKLSSIDRNKAIRIQHRIGRYHYFPQLFKFLELQCVAKIQTPVLIDQPKHYKSQNHKLAKALMSDGEVLFFRESLRSSFQRYLSNIDSKLMQNKILKCFEIGQVYTQEHSYIQESTQLSYDQISLLDDGLVSCIMMGIQTLTIIGLAVTKIKINYEPLIQELLLVTEIKGKVVDAIFQYMTGVVKLNSALNSTKLKQFILNDPKSKSFEKYLNQIDRLIQLFQHRCKLSELCFPEPFQSKENGEIMRSELVQLAEKLSQHICTAKRHKWQLGDIQIIFDTSINNADMGFNKGYHFEIEAQGFNTNQAVISGGSYKKSFRKLQTICSMIFDAPKKIEVNLNYLGPPQRSTSQNVQKQDLPLSKVNSEQLAQGVHLTQIYKQKLQIQGFTLNLEQIEEYFEQKYNQTLFKYQVLICSNGANLNECKKLISQLCSVLEVSALVYGEDERMPTEDEGQFADRNDIKIMVFLREKLFREKGKVLVRHRKDRNTKVDKDMTLDEFAQFLAKLSQK